MSLVVRRDYDRRAAAYERRWRWYLEATVRETLSRMEVRPDESILDVGAGTGWLLERLAADRASAAPGAAPGPGLLAGVDVSAGMLGVARGRLPGDIVLAQADVIALPFPDGTFHQAVSTSSFHFWVRPLGGLRELFRVLRPGGRLVLTDWSRDFWGPRLREPYLLLRDASHVRTWRRDEAEGILREAGFRVLGGDLYRIRPTWGMMTLRAERPGVGE